MSNPLNGLNPGCIEPVHTLGFKKVRANLYGKMLTTGLYGELSTITQRLVAIQLWPEFKSRLATKVAGLFELTSHKISFSTDE